TRAVSGLSGLATHSASTRRRPVVRAPAGDSAGAFDVRTDGNPGSTLSPRDRGSPRTNTNLSGGAAPAPGPHTARASPGARLPLQLGLFPDAGLVQLVLLGGDALRDVLLDDVLPPLRVLEVVLLAAGQVRPQRVLDRLHLSLDLGQPLLERGDLLLLQLGVRP